MSDENIRIDGPILRPEARPLHWSRLNRSQRGTFLKILQAMDEAKRDLDRLRAVESKGKEAPPPNLLQQSDPYRSSRLIFLSGERGSGKSTVMISLLQAFLDAPAARLEGDAASGHRGDRAKVKPEDRIPPLLACLASRIVWLEPLDMEPLPRPTNLLAAILARIDKAATRFVSGAGDSPRPAGLLNLASGEKALMELKKLAADVAIAWDGNVEQRGAALDPDSFAEEVNRIEWARLGINARLDESLDALARELERTREVTNPFFVLPVDDYDLNPLRALDLLQLIRMISSPRLFILVLGDVRMAEMVFNLKKSGEFAAILQHARQSSYLALSPPEIATMARTLSGHAIRKLVPPGQRLLLGNMEVDDALTFHPLRDVRSKGQRCLGALLQSLPVDIETAAHDSSGEPCIGGRRISNFKDFLCCNLLAKPAPSPSGAPTPEEEAEKAERGDRLSKHPYPYTGAALLRATPRYVADLWFSMAELVKGEGLPSAGGARRDRLDELIEVIGQEAHRAVEEDHLLSIHDRERFIDALGTGPDEGWLQAMKFVEARSVSVPGRLVPFRDREERCTLNAHYRRSWTFWNLDQDKPIEIGERAKALLILLHDLLALEQDGGIVGSHALSPDSMNLGWAFASWDVGLAEEIMVPWITPAWTSFWEFEQFGHLWQEALHGKVWNLDEDAQRAYLAYQWIAGVTRLLTGGLEERRIASGSDIRTMSDLWEELETCIKDLVGEVVASPGAATVLNSARVDRIESWLVRLPVLLAPESGFLPGELRILETSARKLFTDPGVQQFFNEPRIRSKVRRLRADRLAPFIGTEQFDKFLDAKLIANSLIHSLEPKEVKAEARLRAAKKGAVDPQQRIAAALELLAEHLGESRSPGSSTAAPVASPKQRRPKARA